MLKPENRSHMCVYYIILGGVCQYFFAKIPLLEKITRSFWEKTAAFCPEMRCVSQGKTNENSIKTEKPLFV